jgi:TatD DNase family protein
MRYFDAHCHIQMDEYDTDRAAVLARMQDVEVGGLIVGVDLASSEAALAVVKESGRSDLFAAVGLHPNDVEQGFDYGAFEKLVADPSVRAGRGVRT